MSRICRFLFRNLPFTKIEKIIGPQDGGDIEQPEEVIEVNEQEVAIEPTYKKLKHQPRYLWCLDNGHGIYTSGKRSPILEDGRQLLEYAFNRDIVRRIEILLKALGVKYFIVVPEVDVGNYLEQRVFAANNEPSELPKLFVSVHGNAAPAHFGKWCAPSISGVETWYYHSSNRGRKMAATFQRHLVGKTGMKNRHIKSRTANQFYVLRKTGMTAVLTENGFYNNKAECKRMLTEEVREQIARAHVDAIMEIEFNGL